MASLRETQLSSWNNKVCRYIILFRPDRTIEYVYSELAHSVLLSVYNFLNYTIETHLKTSGSARFLLTESIHFFSWQPYPPLQITPISARLRGTRHKKFHTLFTLRYLRNHGYELLPHYTNFFCSNFFSRLGIVARGFDGTPQYDMRKHRNMPERRRGGVRPC